MKKSLIVALFALAASSAFAITGNEVVQEYFDTNPAPLYSRTVFEVISYKNGKQDGSATTVNQFGYSDNGKIETVFEIAKNPELKDTRILQSKKEKIQQRWVYLPSMKSVRRINVGGGSKPFLSSEFTYNDTCLRQLDEDEQEYRGEATIVIDGKNSYSCYIVRSTPIDKRDVEFAYREQYFDKNTKMPVRIEYFNKNGKKIKVMEIKEMMEMTASNGKKYHVRKVCVAENLETGRSSNLSVVKMELDTQIPKTYFTQNWLNTGKK